MTTAGRLALVFIVLVVLLAAAAAAALLVAVGVGAAGLGGARSEVPPVLAIEIEGNLPENASADAVSQLLEPGRGDLRNVLLALHRAVDDPRIEGLFVRIERPSFGWSRAEELREAVLAFREAGKWSAVQLDSASSNLAYYLASGFDEVFLAPPGEIGLLGLRVEQPFARGLLQRLGVEPQFVRRKEYKAAANVFTERGFTASHEEATRALLESFHGHLVDAISQGRGLTRERVQELIDNGPYRAQEALNKGLVDHLAYRDQVVDELSERAGSDPPFVRWQRYLARAPRGAGGPAVAIVYAEGSIQRGESGSGLLSGRSMGAETIARAVERARRDDRIAAVVLRIDSPGGSYVASDLIRREVALTAKRKPVVASFGNAAASGGYFIGMQADRIVTNELTTTGSIGVLSGKLVTADMWESKLGVRFRGLQTGDNAELYSSQEPFDDKGWQRINTLLDDIYRDFVSKAAEGRGMAYQELERVARGRVWSGRDAIERGLADVEGGLMQAIDEAKRLAEIPEDRPVRLFVLPRPPGVWESLRQGRFGDWLALAEGGLPAVLDRLEPAPATGRIEDPALPRVR